MPGYLTHDQRINSNQHRKSDDILIYCTVYQNPTTYQNFIEFHSVVCLLFKVKNYGVEPEV